MSSINAFVGHSFTEEDEVLVGMFLDYFDTIKDMNISFDWDHAKKAQAEVLSQKVIEKMKNANTFIGICTKKERVIKNIELKKCFLSEINYKINNTNYDWKTSDWIIQEIGCAVGRGMKIILLIEEGQRKPGGLQGNLEYITFTRKNLQKAFKQILEMINILIDDPEKVSTFTGSRKEKTIAPEKESKKENLDKNQPIEIKDHWAEKDYENGLMESIFLNDSNAKNEIIDSFNVKFCKDDPDKFINFKSFELYIEFVFNKKDTLSELKQLLKENPNNPKLSRQLGLIYEKIEEHGYAYKHFSLAFENSSETKIKLNDLSKAAKNYLKNGGENYKKFIYQMIDLNIDNEYDSKIFSALSTISKDIKNDFLYSISTEAYLIGKPLDHDNRFSLAYRYGEIEETKLAYYHYRFLNNNQKDEDSSYWNNFGVEASNLELNTISVEAYRKAENLGGTLAMSNLANKFINVGFTEEGESLCKKAMSFDNYDRRNLEALSTIETIKKNEEEREKVLLEDVNKKKATIIKISKGLLLKQIKNLPNKYKHPNCTLEAECQDDIIKFSGKYKNEAFSGLLGLAAFGSVSDKKLIDYKIEMVGNSVGHLIEGKYVNQKIDPEKETILKSGEDEIEIVMLVSDDKKLIEVFNKNNYIKIFELKSVE
jgi:hypothetical protein